MPEEIDLSGTAIGPKPLPDPAMQIAPQGMRMFTVYRQVDSTGVSGVGTIAQGVLFATGDVAIQWLSPTSGPHGDLQIKRSLGIFLDTHIHPHPSNKTIITWDDGHQDFFPKEEKES